MPKFDWARFAAGVAMLLVSVVISTVLVRHSDAIAGNTRAITAVQRDVEHLDRDTMSVKERGDLCASIAALQQSVKQLSKQLDRLDRTVERLSE